MVFSALMFFCKELVEPGSWHHLYQRLCLCRGRQRGGLHCALAFCESPKMLRTHRELELIILQTHDDTKISLVLSFFCQQKHSKTSVFEIGTFEMFFFKGGNQLNSTSQILFFSPFFKTCQSLFHVSMSK